VQHWQEVKEEEEEDSWISAEDYQSDWISICIICLYCNSSHIKIIALISK
jgi:hypothetical protein